MGTLKGFPNPPAKGSAWPSHAPPTRRTTGRLRGCLLALSLALVGCGDINAGSQPFAGTVSYTSPDKAYHLQLLEPPWVPVTLPTETVFLVPSSIISVSAAAEESDAIYTLHVTPRPGNAAAAFQSSASAQTPPWDLSTRQSVVVIGGQSGLDISWQESATVYHREAHIDGATSASSFELLFTGPKPLAGDGMILQMIISFGPGPAGN